MKRTHPIIAIFIIGLMSSAIFIGVTTFRETAFQQDSHYIEGIISTQINSALLGFFYENIGQVVDPDILFLGRITSGLVGFAKNRIVILNVTDGSSITLSFETKLEVDPQGRDESKHITNFIQGADVRLTGIKGFSTLIYKEVWPGISVHCRTDNAGIMISFELAKDADPANIRIATSQKQLLRTTDESIFIYNDQTNIVIDDLDVFQDQARVSANFREIDSNSFGFQIDTGSSPLPIIVETILHSSDMDGSDYDIPFSLAMGPYGNAFVTGYTLSSDFSLENPLDTSYNGDGDIFVFKIDLSENAIIYSTFIGGRDRDVGTAIAVDSAGNAYVTGRTQSVNFPVLLAYDSSFNGGVNDCFVLKLNSVGDSLLYSTYIGGSANDYAESLAVDASGAVYVAGYTSSSDFPTINGYNLIFNGGFSDTFVFKLDISGEDLIYSTYVGGSRTDSAVSISLDDIGSAYVAGYTYSDDFSIVGAIDYTYNGYRDAVVYKLSPNGSQLVYSTFLGGGWIDQAESITVDRYGNAIVTGTTYSDDFPTINAYDDTQNGGSDCFISVIGSDGSSLLFSTFLGGSGNDFGLSLSVDSMGYIYVSGDTESQDFPTKNTDPSVMNGTSSTFVTKFNISYDSILYSTFLGGYLNTSIRSMAVDSYGNAFIAGYRTFSVTRYNLLGSFIASSTDVFVLRLADFSDSDFDGLLDHIENELGLNRFSEDTDADGLYDEQEVNLYGTDPLSNDTDSDGLNDGFELDVAHTNPLLSDSDGDELSDGLEVLTHGTNPNAVDTDEDSLDDYEEVNIYGTDPLIPDSDIDTISDADEILVYGTNPLSNDTDSDEMPDSWEIMNGLNPISNDSLDDLDSDSLTNIDEYFLGTNPDNNDTDADNLNDALEVGVFGTNPLQNDSDNDALSDYDEIFVHGTNATNDDTDYDLMPDSWEIIHGLNALGNDSAGDVDLDGLSNLMEYLNGANPNLNDTDGDALDDFAEVVLYGTLPNSTDSDLDNLSDFSEIFTYFTDPLNNDTDFDQLSDAQEVQTYFTNPLNNDTDSDIMPDGWEALNSLNPLVNDSIGDDDFDMLSNIAEYLNGTNPQNNDTDSDNLSDFVELDVYNTDPTNADSDSDDVSDADEIFLHITNPNDNDTDNDLMLDGWEVQFGLNPTVNDTLGDIDSDGLSNLQEFIYSANPLLNDTDLDGLLDDYEVFILGTSPSTNDTDLDDMPDPWEVFYGLNATYNDASEDADADGLPNWSEFLNNSNPTIDDSDFDGLSDFEEVTIYYTKPDTPDSDEDSLTDFDEVTKIRTNPNSNDTDADNMPDPWEISFDLNPLLNDSTEDADSDGLTNQEEYENNTNPMMRDSDSDLLSDYDELNVYLTNPLDSDSDEDELSDYEEVITFKTNPLSDDSDLDQLPDSWEVSMDLDPLRADSSEDPDSDGLTNLNEYLHGSNPLLLDSDSDELTDVQEIETYGTNPSDSDSDNDGLSDADEVLSYHTDPLIFDSDHDGIGDGREIIHYSTNPLLADSDSDSMNDLWEVTYGLDPLFDDGGADADNDGLTNMAEYTLGTSPIDSDSDNDELDDYSESVTYGTSPTLADTDSDGTPDGWEILYGFDPLSNDSFTDSDTDGLTEIEEYQYGSSPLSSDTDSDGLGDFEEATIYYTNPTSNDSDLDGLFDFDEIMVIGTSPLLRDTDDDGMSDPWEVTHNLNATTNDADLDPDFDGLTNLQEYIHRTDPNNADSDNDGLIDLIEINQFGTSPNMVDTDSDSLSDFFEIYTSGSNPTLNDTDNDGLLDALEVEIGTDPSSIDTDLDGISDLWEFTNGYDPTDANVALQEFLHYNAIWIVGISVVALFGVVIYSIRRYPNQTRFRFG